MDDERFDLDFHLRHASVPSPGGRFELERAVGRVLSRPLDRTKPLWELYVFEDLAEDRTAVLLKLHHAMADGIGGMMIASALFDLAPDARSGRPMRAWLPEPAPPPQDLIRDAVEELVLHPLQGLTHLARQPRIFARELRRHRRRASDRGGDGDAATRSVRREGRSQPSIRDGRAAVRGVPGDQGASSVGP